MKPQPKAEIVVIRSQSPRLGVFLHFHYTSPEAYHWLCKNIKPYLMSPIDSEEAHAFFGQVRPNFDIDEVEEYAKTGYADTAQE